MRLAVLITSYNRKNTTLSCLKALYKNKEDFDVFLVDDGSTDGTSEAISKEYPQINLIKGNGNLYWNRGMLLAWKTAVKHYDYDFYLWLNDDTLLFENALEVLFKSFVKAQKQSQQDAIIVGSTKDKNTGKRTYGGRIRRNKYDYLASKIVSPSSTIKSVDTFNGNIVLISKLIFSQLGFLDKEYNHAFGDIDYGLRANKLKIPIFLAPSYLGYCANNAELKKWINPKVSFIERWKDLNSPKGLPLKQWKHYVKKHTGIMWPIFYLKVILRVFFPSLWK